MLEIVDPHDLVDEVPDNLLDDDEYFARHPENEEEGENGDGDDDEDSDSEDENDDGGNDGAESESNSEEAEIVETVEPLEVENIEVIEPMIAQEAMAEAETMAQIVEEADAGIADPTAVDIPTTSSQFAENIEQVLESSPNVVSKIDEDEKEKRIAELEEMVAKLIEANDLLKASNERKKKRFDEYWDIHNQNLKTFKKLDEDHVKLVDEHMKLKVDYEKLKEEHENRKYDYKELKAECNTLEAEKEMLEKWLEETKPKKAGSSSDKDFSDEVVETTEAHVPKVYLTRARGTTNVGIRVESPIIIPDEAVAETVISDKAEGKRKLDAIPEIFGDEESSKKAKIVETVQIEPIQSVAVVETEIAKTVQVEPIRSESVAETEVFEATESEKEVGSEETVQVEPIQSEAVEVESVLENVPEVANQFEPVQNDDAPMIEALDDLDDIDFTESDDEAEPVQNVVEEIPDDLDQRLEKENLKIKIDQIREHLKAAQDRQKSYADKRRRPIEFQVGDFVMLKVSPWKGVIRFRKRGKLSPRFIGPFKIIARVGKVAYRLELPEELNGIHNTFHVSYLRKCLADETACVPLNDIEVDDKLNYVEKPVAILDRKVKQLRNKIINQVKVQWKHRRGSDTTWEAEDEMRKYYPEIFDM
ncbi:hypothetical protein QVD17_41429 [Tagetes erecta]|uniref:Tf2-1-like SH3-like domain-containing protein n=1 Tax=Tagetes erecta TaxID=13708 RepID=A0AAD8NEQ1_TARER|nr:hypothetical protein QVD17_41429 [Tagetes erecta]